MIGFSLFAVFVAGIGVLGARLIRHAEPMAKAIGLAALLGIGALIIEGCSLDTFALPQLWILPGLAVAANRIANTPEAAS